jgi:peptidylprolyl isomerase
MRSLLLLSAALLVGAAPPKPKPLTPTDIVNAAPKSVWKQVPSDDLLVMDLQNGSRVVMQLAPQFAPVHVANIRALARGNYWDGATIYRVQDAYVVQWGQNDSEKGFPAGVVAKPPAEYTRPFKGLAVKPLGHDDSYAPRAGFVDGWPIAYSSKGNWANLAHCYGSVGVGRDLSPDTGTGGELYAAINPLRHLDRNIAVVGRIIDGMGNLSSLPRGTEALGFYKDKSMYVPIAKVRLASSMPEAERPAYEYMDTQSASFAKYLRLRANRHDDFYIRPAGGVDLCNVSPPVRRKG